MLSTYVATVRTHSSPHNSVCQQAVVICQCGQNFIRRMPRLASHNQLFRTNVLCNSGARSRLCSSVIHSRSTPIALRHIQWWRDPADTHHIFASGFFRRVLAAGLRIKNLARATVHFAEPRVKQLDTFVGEQSAMKKVRTSCSGSSPQGTDRQDDDGSTSSPRRSKRLAYKTPFWSPASAASTEVSQPHSINLLAGQCSQQPSSCGPPSLALTDDKPSVASTFQLSFSTAATGLASFRDTDRCGLWGVLPEELVEVILRQCTPPQLGMLESTCSHFRHNKLIEKIAKQKLKLVPRAR
ncbi:uncharacterized protein HaLaN_08918, partial [Haematococcus lacustris]